MTPTQIKVESLRAGEVGFMSAAIRYLKEKIIII